MIVFSDFSLSRKQNILPFNKKIIPPYYDLYNLYIVNLDAPNECDAIVELIKIDEILSTGFVDYNEDYLSGYNFYIQTNTKLHIASCTLASNAVKWVESLTNLIKFAPSIIKKHAKHVFLSPTD